MLLGIDCTKDSMNKLIENHTKKLLGENEEPGDNNDPIDKEKKTEIIKQMKDQVPVVLLNQWLEIQPEKSGFAKNDNCLLNADEYSVYSDETLSQALSFKAPKVLQDMAKRKSMMMANNNHIKDQILKLDPKAQVNLTRKLTVNMGAKNKSKFDQSAREIECISELSSDQTESFCGASPLPSIRNSSRKGSIAQSTFNNKKTKLLVSGEIKVEEREVPVMSQESPLKKPEPPIKVIEAQKKVVEAPIKVVEASIRVLEAPSKVPEVIEVPEIPESPTVNKPNLLFKKAECSPPKIKAASEMKYTPKDSKRFFRTEKKADIRIKRKSKTGFTPPQPKENLRERRKRINNLLKNRKINDLLEIDRYIQIRNYPKNIKRIQPANTFFPLPEKDILSFEKGKITFPNFDKNKVNKVKERNGFNQSRERRRIMKNVKEFHNKIDEYGVQGMNATQFTNLPKPSLNLFTQSNIQASSGIKSRPKRKGHTRSKERKFFYHPLLKMARPGKNLRHYSTTNKSLFHKGDQLLIEGKGLRNSMIPICQMK